MYLKSSSTLRPGVRQRSFPNVTLTHVSYAFGLLMIRVNTVGSSCLGEGAIQSRCLLCFGEPRYAL